MNPDHIAKHGTIQTYNFSFKIEKNSNEFAQHNKNNRNKDYSIPLCFEKGKNHLRNNAGSHASGPHTNGKHENDET